jgi:hypothetical protein
VVLVPALVYILAFSQKMAQGTTLAMLMLPVVALGVWQYHSQGNINWRIALIMAGGFVLGAFVGGKGAVILPEELNIMGYVVRDPMRKLFAVLMMALAVRMLLKN